MQAYLTLVRRELTSYFLSPIGYIIVAGVQLLLGLSLVMVLRMLNGKPFDQPVTEAFYNADPCWLILLLATPLVTMRSFALEKFSGTYETLMTTPVSDLQVVLSKFTGALLFYLATWLPLLAYPWLIRHYASDLAVTERGAVLGTFLGVFLFGALYTSLGCFASSLTRSQIVAAMITFALGLGLFLLSLLSLIIPAAPDWLTELRSHISMIEHMRDFTRGIVDTRQVTYYVSLTVMFLFLTLKVVESRRWK